MKKFAILALACCSSLALHAQSLCQSHEVTAFSCPVRGGKTVSICTSKELSSSQGYVYYVFGKHRHIELKYPGDLKNSRSAFTSFFFHPSFDQSLRFSNGGFDYDLTVNTKYTKPSNWNNNLLFVGHGIKTMKKFQCVGMPEFNDFDNVMNSVLHGE